MLIALTFGATAAADVSVDSALNGEWFYEDWEFRFNDGNWEGWSDDSPMLKGTYTAWDGAITIRVNYVHGNILNDFLLEFPLPISFDPKWYSQSEVREMIINGAFELALAEDESLAALFTMFRETIMVMFEEQFGHEFDNRLNEIFLLVEGTYSASGNTLTLVFDGDFFGGGGGEFTRR